MPKPVLVLRAIVASPSDVKAERDSLPAIIEEVNRDTARPARLHIDLIRWEMDAYPDFHPDGPQGIIDPILNIPDADLLIGIIWSRMGTPTPSGRTGTEHEFQTAIESRGRNGRPAIMTYFCERQPPDGASQEQLARVKTFRDQFPREGFSWTYTSVEQFKDEVARQLRTFLRQRISDLWGSEARRLQELDDARASQPPVVAVLGRLSVRTPHDAPVTGEASSALESIGAELARAGWRLMVYDSADEFVARAVTRGYIGSGAAKPKSIRIRRPRSLEQQSFPGQEDHSDYFIDDPAVTEQWEVAFVLSIADADGVLLAGNGQFTLFGGLQAVAERLPMLALARYGGITRDVWGELKSHTLRLATDDELALMAGRSRSPDWPKQCVAALRAQKYRRDSRQIWRI
jgi:hypothetical protein